MSTVKDLRAWCTENGLKKHSKLNKAALLEYIEKHRESIGESEGAQFTIGIHVFKGKDMAASIDIARQACPLHAVQIFTHGPRNTAKVAHDYDAVKKAGDGISLYVHSSYPTNPWGGKKHIFAHTIDQFRSSRDIGSKGVVLHIPKIAPREVAAAIKPLVDGLAKNHIEGQKVILEMKAVRQHTTESYESPEKINRLIDELKAVGVTSDEVGICIDTAHIYAGKATIHTYADGVAYCNALKYPKWICLIHLNGNVYDVKKRSGDKHAVPFDHEDMVWKGLSYKESGCKAFIEYAKINGIDFILEVKDHHTVDQVKTFISLATGK